MTRKVYPPLPITDYSIKGALAGLNEVATYLTFLPLGRYNPATTNGKQIGPSQCRARVAEATIHLRRLLEERQQYAVVKFKRGDRVKITGGDNSFGREIIHPIISYACTFAGQRAAESEGDFPAIVIKEDNLEVVP